MTTTTLKREKSRLRTILLVAAALGTSSATLSGALATLALQEASGSQAQDA
jgi:cytochrome P450